MPELVEIDLRAAVRDAAVAAAEAMAARTAEDERQAARAVATVNIPAVQFTATGGGVLSSSSTAAGVLLGPEDGQQWDVRRLTVSGLSSPSGVYATNSGQVTSPAAGGQIVAISAANITPGFYLIQWSVGLSGTLAAGDVNNFRLRQGTTSLAVSDNPDVSGEWPQQAYGPIYLSGAQGVNIQAVAVGTVGAIYSATVTIVPASGDQVSLFKEVQGAPSAGNPQNYLWTFTAPGSSPGPTWTPSGGCVLRSPETLLLTGSNLATSSVIISGEAAAVDVRWWWKYLL
jgi:hypothetical protein